MNELRKADDLISPENGYLTFEELRHENGNTYWLASELMERLGYGSDEKAMKLFYRAINRATKSLMGLNLDPFSNIAKIDNPDGTTDYKLTRFASYLVVMNADPNKQEVAAAQAYFVAMTRQFELMLKEPEDVVRVGIRQELKEENKHLSGAAQQAGVTDFSRFHNAGYIGMYNMMNVQLAKRRGVDKDDLIDHMGKAEMAANLFRIEMTNARLQRSGNIGQKKSEDVHRDVGSKVRKMVKESTGVNPEDLPVERKLPQVAKQLKIGHKEMKKIDGDSPPKNKTKKKDEPK